MKKATLLLTSCSLLLGASVSFATLFAYEGFDTSNTSAINPAFVDSDGLLQFTGASGSGFTGNWTVTSGSGELSKVMSTGMSFPAKYDGLSSLYGTEVGGSGFNGTNAGSSVYRLNLDSGVASSINALDTYYVSFLGSRQGTPTPETGLDGSAAAGTFLNMYPRPAGARLMNTTSGNGSAGNIQWSGQFGSYAAEEMGWGFWQFNDLNGETVYPYATANVTDFVVVEVSRTSTTAVGLKMWVNPNVDGTADGLLSSTWTDGTNDLSGDWNLYAFGIEAGSQNAQRAGGEWQFDEVRIGSTFDSVAGFTVIPEPSLLGFLFGAIGIGFVLNRRRR